MRHDFISQPAGTEPRLDTHEFIGEQIVYAAREGEVNYSHVMPRRLTAEHLFDAQHQVTCDCERSGETTMGQAFQLISGSAINELLADPDNRLSHWLASGKSNKEILEELYWTALNRPPNETERNKTLAYLEYAKDRRLALEDMTWGVLNAKEFVLRK